MSPRQITITNEQIFEGAACTLARIGPIRATLNDVAETLGIAPATLIKRFGSKHALLVAVSRHHTDKMRAIFDTVAEEGLLDALSAVFDRLTGGLRAHEMANHVAFLQLDLSDPDLRKEALRFATSMRTGFRSLLERAMRCGELSADCDLDALARTVQTCYNGSIVLWSIYAEGRPSAWLRRETEFLLRPFLQSADEGTADCA